MLAETNALSRVDCSSTARRYSDDILSHRAQRCNVFVNQVCLLDHSTPSGAGNPLTVPDPDV